MDSKVLTFDKHISCMLRGLAVTLMVMNHSMPGKMIPFAVQLFSFMVGYGYTFAKSRDLRHSSRRIWHLLSDYWLILFAICLPLALHTAPQKVLAGNVVLCMFGLNASLNFFCWYVYFYILAMLTLPWLSRVVDRYGLKGTLALCAACGLVFWGISYFGTSHKVFGINLIARYARYMPVVIVGYWVGSTQFYSRIRIWQCWPVAVGAALLCVGVYFLRGLPYAMVGDFIWAPLFAALFTAAVGFRKIFMLDTLLTQLGLQSMNIWFLHALFFTHLTRKPFLPLIDWTHNRWLMVLVIIVASYAMARLVSSLSSRISRLDIDPGRLLSYYNRIK